MALVCRLSGSEIQSRVQPPKGRRKERASCSWPGEAVDAMQPPQTEGPSTATVGPTPSCSPFPLRCQGPGAYSHFKLRNLRPSGKWWGGLEAQHKSSVLYLPAPLPSPPAVLSSRCMPWTVLGEARPEGPFPSAPCSPSPSSEGVWALLWRFLLCNQRKLPSDEASPLISE